VACRLAVVAWFGFIFFLCLIYRMFIVHVWDVVVVICFVYLATLFCVMVSCRYLWVSGFVWDGVGLVGLVTLYCCGFGCCFWVGL